MGTANREASCQLCWGVFNHCPDIKLVVHFSCCTQWLEPLLPLKSNPHPQDKNIPLPTTPPLTGWCLLSWLHPAFVWDSCHSFSSWIGVCRQLKPFKSQERNKGSVLGALGAAKASAYSLSSPAMNQQREETAWREPVWQVKGSETWKQSQTPITSQVSLLNWNDFWKRQTKKVDHRPT